ncbi:MAG: hypothetical protein KC413_22310 [Anaerolineales bacterium]|nr:hypothetical protein [Anaerolineales bacterium]
MEEEFNAEAQRRREKKKRKKKKVFVFFVAAVGAAGENLPLQRASGRFGVAICGISADSVNTKTYIFAPAANIAGSLGKFPR